MNYTQSFEEFSAGLQPMDLALYAGIGIILWVLFKDKLSPVQKMILDLIQDVKGSFDTPKNNIKVDLPQLSPIIVPVAPKREVIIAPPAEPETDDVFFKMIASWKETRDLALECKCDKAVEAIDAMFPYLSPTVCGETKNAE